MPISNYCLDLLLAAKPVAIPPHGSSAGDLDASLACLAEAISAFEEQMPLTRQARWSCLTMSVPTDNPTPTSNPWPGIGNTCRVRLGPTLVLDTNLHGSAFTASATNASTSQTIRRT